jgi:ribosomal protein L30E
MAKKKEVSKEIMDMKKELAEGKAVVGTETVLKSLKGGKLNKVYLSSNCPDGVKKDVEYYSSLVKVPVVFLKMNNEEIGVLCKKHFFISVLGVKKK